MDRRTTKRYYDGNAGKPATRSKPGKGGFFSSVFHMQCVTPSNGVKCTAKAPGAVAVPGAFFSGNFSKRRKKS